MGETMHTGGHELVLGGQRSGKSCCAESRAAAWLARPGCSALLLATALAGDDEMRSRIARHRHDRAERVPALGVLEVPHDLPQALREHSTPQRLLIVDCLTLWLVNALMPLHGAGLNEAQAHAQRAALVDALRSVPGPVVLVGNEIGMGISPMSAAARRFVDELGWLHQAVAGCCTDVTLMVAGLEVAVKRGRA